MKSVFVCLVMLAASVPGFAAVTVLENFDTVTISDLIYQDATLIDGVILIGSTGSKNTRVGIHVESFEISFGELLSGEVKIKKGSPAIADPYVMFLVDTNRNGISDLGANNKDDYFMQLNPTFSEPDDKGWSKLTFDLNSQFAKSSSANTRPSTGKALSEWLAQYDNCQIFRYFVCYNMPAANNAGCYIDDLQFKYGTPDVDPETEEPVPATVPVPGAVVLASLGLGVVRYMRGRGRI
ncbi:MAG TPA: hypothetical protein PKB02_00030 [Anaerohalosphaeraceae bacterium]|nr:hypothetical protein [Anaerohalosphaeraceae bacterium]